MAHIKQYIIVACIALCSKGTALLKSIISRDSRQVPSNKQFVIQYYDNSTLPDLSGQESGVRIIDLNDTVKLNNIIWMIQYLLNESNQTYEIMDNATNQNNTKWLSQKVINSQDSRTLPSQGDLKSAFNRSKKKSIVAIKTDYASAEQIIFLALKYDDKIDQDTLKNNLRTKAESLKKAV